GASSSTSPASPGLVTCKWTASGSGDAWDDAAIEVKASVSTTATAPSPPTDLTATTVSSSQINLSWTAPSNNGGSAIIGYKIERSTNGGTFSTFVPSTGSTSTTYSDTGLNPSTSYTYRVSAINSVAGAHNIGAKDAAGNTSTKPITVTPHVFIYPTSGHAGSQILIPDSQGNGFAGNSAITIKFDDIITDTITTNDTGYFGGTFAVPSAATPGTHQ